MEQIRCLLNQNQVQTTEGERYFANIERVQVQYPPSETYSNPNHTGKDYPSFCFNTYSENPTTWVIDSGATDHMCGPNITLSNQKVLTKPIIVHLPNSQITTVNCIGNYKINNNLTLYNVSKITDFNVNLISVTKLTKQLKCCFSFHPNH